MLLTVTLLSQIMLYILKLLKNYISIFLLAILEIFVWKQYFVLNFEKFREINIKKGKKMIQK